MEGVLKSSLIEYLATVDTPTLSNAIKLLPPSAEGFAPLGIRCLFPELNRLCGYAVTAQVETMTALNPKREDPFIELFEAINRSPKPAVVVMQELGPHPDWAVHCGEALATIFSRLGAVGLVSDCAVRDTPEVRALRFRYLARGAAASHANYRLVRVGVPIHVLGLAVQAQGLLHGDENGLITVPEAALERIREAVSSVRSHGARLVGFCSNSWFHCGSASRPLLTLVGRFHAWRDRNRRICFPQLNDQAHGLQAYRQNLRLFVGTCAQGRA
jgi:4-hydroxy-4-methyl-2-oxoglutarate aldolase